MSTSTSVLRFSDGTYLTSELPPDANGELAAAQQLRYRVFVENLGWVRPAEQDELRDVDPYDDKACHFIVTDCLGETVGTIRLLRGGESGFMLDKEFIALVGENGNAVRHSPECAELSRLAVKPELSPKDRHDVAMCLYRAAYAWSGIHGVVHWYVVIEVSFLKVLQRLGFPFRRVGRSHHFQPQVTTVAATLDLTEAARSLRTLDPDRLAWFETIGVPDA